ncbi:MAG TPA: endoglucanase, partial [Verrucomicrobiae bacterium]|nr:endoglucanase [Verrucomicrobiae bacterium]
NYALPANGIMWTAFFAGETLTPNWKIDGVNVQTYLQSHYLGALSAIAARVDHMPHVVGFDTLNEPGLGYIGQALSEPNLATISEGPFPVIPGPRWTPLAGLLAARGQSVRVPVLEKSDQKGKLQRGDDLVINESRTSIWLPGFEDPFEAHGAYRMESDAAIVLNEDFFRVHNGAPIDHENDLMGPFFARMAQVMRAHRPDWIVFAELSPYVLPTGRGFPKETPERTVNASHWYDINLLRTKEHQPKNDPESLKGRYRMQLGYLKYLGGAMNGGAPTLIGEYGIPYDMNDAAAYKVWANGGRGDAVWAHHTEVLSATYDVFDELLLNGTQWNYTASNRNDLRIGDGWNQEDLSIFSLDQVTNPNDLDSGGRAIDGFCRPYAQRVQGVLREMRFDRTARAFEARFDADISIKAPTEIFAPRRVFEKGVSLEASKALADWSYDAKTQTLKVWAAFDGELKVRLRPSALVGVSQLLESPVA